MKQQRKCKSILSLTMLNTVALFRVEVDSIHSRARNLMHSMKRVKKAVLSTLIRKLCCQYKSKILATEKIKQTCKA